jgi:hypothetical protein
VNHFKVRAKLARRIPDPKFHNIEHHFMWVGAPDMPSGIPLDANARKPKVNRALYKDVRESLLDQNGEEGTFHLKNQGIVIVATSVKKVGEDLYDIAIAEGQGILNGGHTTELIVESQEDEAPDNYVLVSIRTGVPNEWIPELSGGLNTSVQVQAKSLDDLAGRFNWLKEALKEEPYFKRIVWREGDQGDVDVRDIIAMMTCLNLDLFSNESDESPIAAYEKKSSCLDWFEEAGSSEGDSYRKLKPMLKNILEFYDTIRFEARGLYNADKADGNKRGGGLAFVDEKKRGKFSFPFISQESEYALNPAAALPILAAFRWMVEPSKDGKTFRWKGGFSRVKQLWAESAAELMRLTKQTSDAVGRKPNALGKSRPHWSNLHARVAKRQMMDERANS